LKGDEITRIHNNVMGAAPPHLTGSIVCSHNTVTVQIAKWPLSEVRKEGFWASLHRDGRVTWAEKAFCKPIDVLSDWHITNMW
jgi:hypothetical protein